MWFAFCIFKVNVERSRIKTFAGKNLLKTVETAINWCTDKYRYENIFFHAFYKVTHIKDVRNALSQTFAIEIEIIRNRSETSTKPLDFECFPDCYSLYWLSLLLFEKNLWFLVEKKLNSLHERPLWYIKPLWYILIPNNK